MKGELLHVFRNTPFGRTTLLRSVHFCRRARRRLAVYIPSRPQFLMYFEDTVATVNLDRSFVREPDKARARLEAILADQGVPWRLVEVRSYTRKVLPELPTDFDFMTCPRTLSDLGQRGVLGVLGPRVREIVAHASFPVFIPGQVPDEWSRLACFYGGGPRAAAVLRLALALKEESGVPLRLYTYDEGPGADGYRRRLDDEGLLAAVELGGCEWRFLAGESLEASLFEVEPDELVVTGAFAGRMARELLFGTFAETLQSVLPNPLLLVGPRVEA